MYANVRCDSDGGGEDGLGVSALFDDVLEAEVAVAGRCYNFS